MNIIHTRLWSEHLAAKKDDKHTDAREKLRNAYKHFWDNAVTLSKEIQKTVPQLTLHDDSHFIALWERADQIAGTNLNLTPLEVFVFGGAVLIHDAANSTAAFKGGIEEIKDSAEWSDSLADWQSEQESLEVDTPPEVEQQILLKVLRSLHAQRAETLCDLEVNAATGTFHLIQDDLIRSHLGELIGKIAASHHWDVEDLSNRLQPNVGAPSGFPADWTVRPMLIAALLRCADAVQIDQKRTPDFLYGLLELRGISETHWRAQNHLATPMIDPSDSSSLLFTSTKAYDINEAEAWWIAYDSIAMASHELIKTNAFLKDFNLPHLAINRLSHSDSPRRLAKHVQTKGWEPVPANVHINNINNIVDMFGGEKLYGNHPHVAIRELIQNAADAIRLRRALENEGSSYNGKITVRLESINNEENSDSWLHIEDDGIGMSEAVLTGPLLDFGGGYLSSAIVRIERPGLVGKKLKRSGKYGIGFFSVFMLSDKVKIVTKPYDAGLAETRTLAFNKGYKQRPMLIKENPKNFGATNSTRVSVLLSKKMKDNILSITKSTFLERTKHPITIQQLIGSIAPIVDIDIFVDNTQVHHQDWHKLDAKKWLKQILLYNTNEAKIDTLSPLVEFINPKNHSIGRAAIATDSNLGVITIGGLATPPSNRHIGKEFIGAIDYIPSGPKRSADQAIARGRLDKWASRQAKAMAKLDLSNYEKFNASCRVANFGGNATPIAVMQLMKNYVTLEGLYNYLLTGNTVFSPIDNYAYKVENKFVITSITDQHDGFSNGYEEDELEYLVASLESPYSTGTTKAYCEVPTTTYNAPLSFLRKLYDFAKTKNTPIKSSLENDIIFAKYVGEDSPRQGLTYGEEITSSGLKLSIETNSN